MINVDDMIQAKVESPIYKEMKGNYTVFKVVEITDGYIKIQNSIGYGIISTNELEQFEKVEYKAPKEEETEKWSTWMYAKSYSCEKYKVYFKTKGRQIHVILAFSEGNTVSARSFAHPEDSYDFSIGLYTAISKALKKYTEPNKRHPLERTYKANTELKRIVNLLELGLQCNVV